VRRYSYYIGGFFSSLDHERFLKDEKKDDEFSHLFPLELKGNKRSLFETGIDALSAIIIESLTRGVKPNLWVPENFCMESLNRLRIKTGKELHIHRYLNPENLIAKENLEGIVLIVHFNLYNSYLRSTINAIRTKFHQGFILVEDFVQAPLDIKKYEGHYAFNSLRKLSSMDVSVAYLDFNFIGASDASPYYIFKKKAETLKSTYLQCPSPELEKEYLTLNRQADEALQDEIIRSPNPIEINRAVKFSYAEVKEIRRKNFETLERELSNISFLGVMPGDYMYFMLTIENRDELRREMMSQGIFSAVHWKDSNSALSGTVLSLHIDQRYSIDDMLYVSATLKSILASH
jgi:hypothetical protein